MKKIITLIGTIIMIVSITAISMAAPLNIEQVETLSGDYGHYSAEEDLNLTIEDMLKYAIQDEYLARAEYELILDEYGNVRIFSNIVNAENTHIDLLESIYDEYGYDVPLDEAKAYVALPGSLEEAYEVGVDAEIYNIKMYEDFLKEDLPTDIKEAFESLMAASENHLKAFENNLDKYR
jgi:hypothetical protein